MRPGSASDAMEDPRRWEEMETDCLIDIIRRLDLEDLTLRVPFVCKSWHRAALNPLCWRSLDFSALSFMPWSGFTKSFMARYSVPRFSFTGFMKLAVGHSWGSVVELRFPSMLGSLEDLVYVSNECPRLKLLGLPNLTSAVEAQIPRIIGKWKDLERLEMESRPSSVRDMVAEISLNCNRFTALKMCGLITKEDAMAIVKHLPKIKCLCLSKAYLRKEELLLIMDGCKELERLSADGCFGFEADGEILRKASGIENFEHEGSRISGDYGYNYVI